MLGSLEQVPCWHGDSDRWFDSQPRQPLLHLISKASLPVFSNRSSPAAKQQFHFKLKSPSVWAPLIGYIFTFRREEEFMESDFPKTMWEFLNFYNSKVKIMDSFIFFWCPAFLNEMNEPGLNCVPCESEQIRADSRDPWTMKLRTVRTDSRVSLVCSFVNYYW